MEEMLSKLSEMTIGQILGGGIGIAFVISIFVEIVPVKLCPITILLEWIGKKINKEVNDKVSELDKNIQNVNQRLDDLGNNCEEREVINCRIRILRFGDEISHGYKHSKESYDQIIDDIDTYDSYCKKHKDFVNNKTHATVKKIINMYSQCMDNNDFL